MLCNKTWPHQLILTELKCSCGMSHLLWHHIKITFNLKSLKPIPVSNISYHLGCILFQSFLCWMIENTLTCDNSLSPFKNISQKLMLTLWVHPHRNHSKICRSCMCFVSRCATCPLNATWRAEALTGRHLSNGQTEVDLFSETYWERVPGTFETRLHFFLILFKVIELRSQKVLLKKKQQQRK